MKQSICDIGVTVRIIGVALNSGIIILHHLSFGTIFVSTKKLDGSVFPAAALVCETRDKYLRNLT